MTKQILFILSCLSDFCGPLYKSLGYTCTLERTCNVKFKLSVCTHLTNMHTMLNIATLK